MALSRLLFMAARIVASNPKLRKEVQKAAEASYTKAKPYINKANENIKEAADEAAKKSPPNENIYKFYNSFGTITKNYFKIKRIKPSFMKVFLR